MQENGELMPTKEAIGSQEAQKRNGCRRRSSASRYSWYNRGDNTPSRVSFGGEHRASAVPVGHSESITGNSAGFKRKTYNEQHAANARKSQTEAGPQTLFADANAMKGALYENIDKKDYDVTDFYKETGLAQKIAKSDIFGNGTLIVICINAVWIGVDSDHNKAESPSDAEIHFQVADQLFCVYFTFELAVRYAAFARKWNCLRDNWFKFDSMLVFMMIVETWVFPIVAAGSGSGGMGNLSLLKILRLLRLTRMVRIMRALPALMTLLKGMTAGLRSVGATCSLLLIFLYIFAIIFQQEHKYHPNENLQKWFGTIPRAMWTLLLTGTFLDDLTHISNTLRDKGTPAYTALFLLFVAISALTIINMLIGVLCEVVSAVASAEKEKAVVTYVKGQLIDVLVELDTDGTGTISKDEFSVFLDIPRAVSALEQLGVDVPNLLLLVDILFDADSAPSTTPLAKSKTNGNLDQVASASVGDTKGEENTSNVELTFAEMLEMILRLRSENVASVPDIVDLRKFIRWGNNITTDAMMDLKKRIHGTKKELGEITSTIHAKLDQMISQEDELVVRPKELPKSDPIGSEGVFSEREALIPSSKNICSPPPSSSNLDKLTNSPNDMLKDTGAVSKDPSESLQQHAPTGISSSFTPPDTPKQHAPTGISSSFTPPSSPREPAEPWQQHPTGISSSFTPPDSPRDPDSSSSQWPPREEMQEENARIREVDPFDDLQVMGERGAQRDGKPPIDIRHVEILEI